jgi:hypothetical protein
MTRIEGEIVINRPLEEVFDFVADERNEPRYTPRMLRAEKISPGPIGVGTRFRAETKTMRGSAEMVIEVTAYERLRRLGSSTQLSLMEIHGTLAFEPFRERTRMHWEWDVEPRGLFNPFSSRVAWMGRRQERRIWASLKRYLEAQPDALIVPQE